MQSQGEHIRTWRKRWFVLKQGFLFRFAAPDPAAAAKPRGIVDLSTVTDVSDGRAATGRPHSIKLSTASGGHILYLCENETSQVMRGGGVGGVGGFGGRAGTRCVSLRGGGATGCGWSQCQPSKGGSSGPGGAAQATGGNLQPRLRC